MSDPCACDDWDVYDGYAECAHPVPVKIAYTRDVSGRHYAFDATTDAALTSVNGARGWKAQTNLVRSLQANGYNITRKP